MRYDSRYGMFFPVIHDLETVDGKGEEFSVCPGKGYPIIRLSRRFEGEGAKRTVELGVWRNAWAARSSDAAILQNASSGGVMTAIAEYLIMTGRVDGALVTGFHYGSNGPWPKAYLARTREELLASQGSKYCPSPTLVALSNVLEADETFAVIGTPCQIAGLRLLQEHRPPLREKFPFTIGNFCGGFRNLRETETLVQRAGLAPSRITRFRYRGGGQPGSMRMEDDTGTTADLPYPEYVRRTGFVKVRRCRMCVDATAELADFSCGDAWLPRFLNSGSPWSIVMARTNEASAILDSMAKQRRLVLEDISVDEIKRSQRGNLHSKKTRQAARRRLFKILTFSLPDFDGGFSPTGGGSVLFELKVLLKGAVLHNLEKSGLYPTLAKLFRTRTFHG